MTCFGRQLRPLSSDTTGWYYPQLTNYLTNSTQQIPSWEANNSSASQEIPRNLRHPKVHYRTHNSLPPVPLLSQINLIHSSQSDILKNHFNIILSSTLRDSKWPLSIRLYLLTPWSRVLKNLTGFQLVKKFPAFYVTRRFITAFTTARHLSLSSGSSIQSIPPHSTSWKSILILSSHLPLVLPSGLLPSGFPTKTLYTPLLSPIRATCPAHLIILDFITRVILGDEYRSLSFSLCSFLHFPATSSLLGSLSPRHGVSSGCGWRNGLQ